MFLGLCKTLEIHCKQDTWGEPQLQNTITVGSWGAEKINDSSTHTQKKQQKKQNRRIAVNQ